MSTLLPKPLLQSITSVSSSTFSRFNRQSESKYCSGGHAHARFQTQNWTQHSMDDDEHTWVSEVVYDGAKLSCITRSNTSISSIITASSAILFSMDHRSRLDALVCSSMSKRTVCTLPLNASASASTGQDGRGDVSVQNVYWRNKNGEVDWTAENCAVARCTFCSERDLKGARATVDVLHEFLHVPAKWSKNRWFHKQELDNPIQMHSEETVRGARNTRQKLVTSNPSRPHP